MCGDTAGRDDMSIRRECLYREVHSTLSAVLVDTSNAAGGDRQTSGGVGSIRIDSWGKHCAKSHTKPTPLPGKNSLAFRPTPALSSESLRK